MDKNYYNQFESYMGGVFLNKINDFFNAYNQSNRKRLNEILSQYRSPENPLIFIRKIGSKGEFSNYSYLVARKYK